MIYRVFVGIFSFLFMAGCIGLVALFWYKQYVSAYERPDRGWGQQIDEEAEAKKKEAADLVVKRLGAFKLLSAIGAIVFFAVFLFIPWCWHTVNAGELAVVKHLGQITHVRTAGTYFDFWMTDSYTYYDAKVQNIDIDEQTYSSDAQTMDIAMTIQYQIDPTKAIEIASNYGTLEVLENRIRSVSVEQMKSVLAEYKGLDIIANRAAMSPAVSEAVKAAITGNYYVDITTVVLTDISFSDKFEKAVEDQMVAEREKERAITQAEQERETALIRAEQERETARIEAEAKLLAAKGDADAQRAIADAEAYTASIKIIELARSLGYEVVETKITEEQNDGNGGTVEVVVGTNYQISWGEDKEGKEAILSYLKYLEYLATWDGKLPEIVAGDGDLSLLIPNGSFSNNG